MPSPKLPQEKFAQGSGFASVHRQLQHSHNFHAMVSDMVTEEGAASQLMARRGGSLEALFESLRIGMTTAAELAPETHVRKESVVDLESYANMQLPKGAR